MNHGSFNLRLDYRNSTDSSEALIVIVDSHQQVLTAWAEVRRQLPSAPRLITLDHHTDTSRPFRRHLRDVDPDDYRRMQNDLIEAIDFTQPGTVEEAVENLNNDEHVLTAIQADIVSSAMVIAQNAMDTDLACYQEHRVICREVKNDQWDEVLETHLIDRAIAGFDRILRANGEEHLLDGKYILDIDLDYFKSFQSIAPQDPSRIIDLAKNAELVTVATEPEYVKSCAVDSGLSSDYLLEKLTALIWRLTARRFEW